MDSKPVTIRSTRITKDKDGNVIGKRESVWQATQYDPNDPNDPLRHNYLARKAHSTVDVLPIRKKIANGLGVTEEESIRVVQDDGVEVERVPLGFRKRLARTLGIGA